MADKPVKKSMYEEDMERMTKEVMPNKPLPSNYSVGKTDSSGMTLMPNGNWRSAEGKTFTHVKPTVNLPPKDEAEIIRDEIQKARAEKKGITVEQMRQNMSDEFDKRVKAGDLYKKGGSIKSSASKRADGCCVKGHTKGRYM